MYTARSKLFPTVLSIELSYLNSILLVVVLVVHTTDAVSYIECLCGELYKVNIPNLTRTQQNASRYGMNEQELLDSVCENNFKIRYESFQITNTLDSSREYSIDDGLPSPEQLRSKVASLQEVLNQSKKDLTSLLNAKGMTIEDAAKSFQEVQSQYDTTRQALEELELTQTPIVRHDSDIGLKGDGDDDSIFLDELNGQVVDMSTPVMVRVRQDHEYSLNEVLDFSQLEREQLEESSNQEKNTSIIRLQNETDEESDETASPPDSPLEQRSSIQQNSVISRRKASIRRFIIPSSISDRAPSVPNPQSTLIDFGGNNFAGFRANTQAASLFTVATDANSRNDLDKDDVAKSKIDEGLLAQSPVVDAQQVDPETEPSEDESLDTPQEPQLVTLPEEPLDRPEDQSGDPGDEPLNETRESEVPSEKSLEALEASEVPSTAPMVQPMEPIEQPQQQPVEPLEQVVEDSVEKPVEQPRERTLDQPEQPLKETGDELLEDAPKEVLEEPLADAPKEFEEPASPLKSPLKNVLNSATEINATSETNLDVHEEYVSAEANIEDEASHGQYNTPGFGKQEMEEPHNESSENSKDKENKQELEENTLQKDDQPSLQLDPDKSVKHTEIEDHHSLVDQISHSFVHRSPEKANASFWQNEEPESNAKVDKDNEGLSQHGHTNDELLLQLTTNMAAIQQQIVVLQQGIQRIETERNQKEEQQRYVHEPVRGFDTLHQEALVRRVYTTQLKEQRSALQFQCQFQANVIAQYRKLTEQLLFGRGKDQDDGKDESIYYDMYYQLQDSRPVSLRGVIYMVMATIRIRRRVNFRLLQHCKLRTTLDRLKKVSIQG